MDNVYTTTHMYLATALSSEGFVLIEIDSREPRKKFVFQDTDELQDAVQRFHNRKMLVEPNELFYQLKLIRARLYS